MRKLLLALACLLAFLCGARAQFGSFADVPIEIDAEETRIEGGVAIADRHVVIRYGAVLIYADYAQYNPETRDVLVQGNVRIYREGQLFTGERALYNLETKRLGIFRDTFGIRRFGKAASMRLRTSASTTFKGIGGNNCASGNVG